MWETERAGNKWSENEEEAIPHGEGTGGQSDCGRDPRPSRGNIAKGDLLMGTCMGVFVVRDGFIFKVERN